MHCKINIHKIKRKKEKTSSLNHYTANKQGRTHHEQMIKTEGGQKNIIEHNVITNELKQEPVLTTPMSANERPVWTNNDFSVKET